MDEYDRAMSKITFRADDDLVERVEAVDASKSEVMRQALRAYLDDEPATESETRSLGAGTTLDELLAARVDELVEDHLAARRAAERDVNVNVNLDPALGGRQAPAREHAPQRADREPEELTCTQCGEAIEESHEYCPNCGAKANGPDVCACGIELSPDWAYCPACGRPAAQAVPE
ncbi:MAG: zinc-ribbon domain-containing protein [Halanaeroarchaeum sp.]